MTIAAPPVVVPPESAARSRWTLIAVCAATFILLVDVTIVQVALPTIQRHLNASFTDLQWVIDAYALTLATLILTWGSIADLLGRKRVFIAGLAVFTVSSLLCGLAQSINMLIWSRALQGVGGAAMFATGLALIAQDFQGPARGKAIAAWGATVGGAGAVGPIVGGALTGGIGWRWIFIVNVPVGVVAIWISLTKMRNQKDPGATRLDGLGLATFAAAMFLLEFGLVRGNDLGWTSGTTVAMFAGSAAAFLAFVLVELFQTRPMLDLSLFRNPSFGAVSVATFAIGGGMFALLPYLTLYLQNDLGYSPFQGGLRLLPWTLLASLVPFVFRRPAHSLPPGLALGAGFAITAGGIAAMLAVGPDSSWMVLIPGLVLCGIGLGIANPAIARVGLGVVPPQRSGMASGISNTFRIAGLATGIAALGAIFQQRITTSLSSSVGAHAAALGNVVSSAGVTAAAHGQARTADAAHVAFVSGLHTIFVIGAIAVAAGAVISVVLVRSKDFPQPTRPMAPTEPESVAPMADHSTYAAVPLLAAGGSRRSVFAPNRSPDPNHVPGLPQRDLAGFTHRWVDAEGIQLHAIEGGRSSGPTVVLLAGFPQTWWAWHKAMSRLAERFHVIAIDLPGQGHSDRPQGSYDTHTVASRVQAAVTALNVPKYWLVAHDIGASVAFSLALKYQDRLHGVAMLDAGIPGITLPDAIPTDPERAWKTWHLAFHVVPELPETLITGREREYVDWFLRVKTLSPNTFDSADIDHYAAAIAAEGGLRAFLAYFRDAEQSARRNQEALASGRGTLTIPVLGVSSSHGSIPDMAASISPWAENVTGVVIPEAGHFIPDEQPDATVKALNAFIDHAHVG